MLSKLYLSLHFTLLSTLRLLQALCDPTATRLCKFLRSDVLISSYDLFMRCVHQCLFLSCPSLLAHKLQREQDLLGGGIRSAAAPFPGGARAQTQGVCQTSRVTRIISIVTAAPKLWTVCVSQQLLWSYPGKDCVSLWFEQCRK
jgi:hypothetical protein